MSKKNYHYNLITKEFTHNSDALTANLLGTITYAYALDASPDEPPKAPAGKIAICNPDTKVWSLTDDFRGKIFYDVDGNEVIIEDLGPVDSSLSATKPKPSLDQIKEQQIGLIIDPYSRAVKNDIEFTTAGKITKKFQTNRNSIASMQLAASTQVSTNKDFVWISSDNMQVSFTAADLLSLINAISIRNNTLFIKLQTLKTNIRAASTVAKIQAITW